MRKLNELMTTVKNGVTSSTGKLQLKMEKHAPEILLGVGILSLVGTVAMACRAGLKCSDIMDEHEQAMENVKKAKEITQNEVLDSDGDVITYTEEDAKRDTMIIYSKTVVGTLKAFAPVIALGSLTVVSILASRNILNKRYLGAVAAYNAVSEAFETYRQRVRDEAGDMMDRHYRFGTELREVTVEETDENGKKKKHKELQEVLGTGEVNLNDVARWFDKSNVNFQTIPNYSMMFLRGRQTYLNDRLRERGFVTLNEAYEALGFKPTTTGMISGWIDDGKTTIDFGIFEPDDENRRRFVNGEYEEILLDFNIQGIIWDRI